MKLSEIRSTIRKTKGNPEILVELASGKRYWLALQKEPLMEALGDAFDGSLSAETGMRFVPHDEKGGRLYLQDQGGGVPQEELEPEVVEAAPPPKRVALLDDL